MSRPPPGRYSDYETPWDPSIPHMSSRSLAAGQNQNSSTPSILLRARGSESGSVFHEEVWPPPGDRSRLVDPLSDHGANYSDLSRIVDDVMGPSAATEGIHYSQYSLSSSMREPSGDSLHSGLHSRSWSADSQSQLLEAAGLIPSSTPPSPSRQPIKPSPLAESNAAAGGSMTAATSKNWLHRSPLKNEVDPRDGLADDTPHAL
ncbi:hypothetical protein SERLA73DRAFT_130785 [Serpula lacrymans var. lacrymans S7.3]|uniref:Uncharacterized protein n=2 Tax=Serpula lacrymans var. lacrymans TaxID=341189 RepID=F8PJI1_SERL3|nr:uncharacterized protein SERLADRAFT_379735 [Serpula lacrymans var. lacrymans S7.9]EGO04119.1 hypothetical protein SERLA73DRAFT_130785 [Serpula lacrymans var. lacrymans S7.3]EGO30047.1 hypothetical protein SERLADRAFT_379735 [Serpula lacrymans var. lacrymans S7.9]